MSHDKIQFKTFSPSSSHHPIIGFQSKYTRSLTVGYLKKKKLSHSFVPCRLNMGYTREEDTYHATVQSLNLPLIQSILKKYKPDEISTVTLLRETLACRLSSALAEVGVPTHYGDAFIGANHKKTDHTITTEYKYENIEGLATDGLWIIADSIAAGRNLIATLKSLLGQFHPKEILFISPIGNRWGIDKVSEFIKPFNIPTTFVVWGALFGLNPENRYDEPWGLPDCEPVDTRDQKVFVNMYSTNLCVGGDFGNDYYCPALALKLYDTQLKNLGIKPKIPTAKALLKIYKKEELVIR